GKPAIRGFYQRLFPALKGERAENLMRVYGEDLIVDETILIGTVVDGRPFSLPGRRGENVRVRLLHVFKLRDGLIADEKVWFDADELRRQLK
ncbi:MAG TPA: nuclear transport factor 2 family protein, partial [Burkholderiales bacterium]|nr:nuclear transport factor 2 family protein [Burkholderiales bacterium]